MDSDEREADVADLRRRLEDAEETLRAIRAGEVDALVVGGPDGERVYTLQGADHPYRTLIEAMQQGAVSLAGDGTILYCNRRFAEMVARPQERVIGASAAEFLAPEHRADFETLLRRGRLQGSQGELRLETADGTPTAVYLALAPLPLAEAGALCMVVTDLTEQKEHQCLQEVNRRKDEFLAMLAHELRNPLAPIRNALYLMKQGGPEVGAAEEVRAMMDRQVEHLARLIDDLMDVSRIATGKVELRREPVDLAAVVRRAVETSRPLMSHKGHELTVRLPPDPIRLDADPTRLEQVIDNLLTNAAKYSDPGGRIDLSVRREGDAAVLTFRDTGIGIAAEKLPHIFGLFVQAERRMDRSQGGLGVGLSLVRSLVEMHGGSVTATSEGLGRGSEFVVRLPALPATDVPDLPETPDDRARAASALPRRRILVVDDNVDSARSMAMLLGRTWGQDVEVAHDGESALAIFEEFAPEVMLLDIGLPDMSGFEVAERLHRRVDPIRTVLVAMTGWGQEEDIRRSRESGFAHHLVKPVDLGVLRNLLLDEFAGPSGTEAGAEHPAER
jgi:PAS domain S-box-containing protein